MAFSIRSAIASSKLLTGEGAGSHADRRDRITTFVAASVAVLIVATIAVLMGMA